MLSLVVTVVELTVVVAPFTTRLPVTVPIVASPTVKTPVPGLYLNVSSVYINLSPVWLSKNDIK